MKCIKLTENLQLRHSEDGYTLAFRSTSGGAVLNLSKIANEMKGFIGKKMLEAMRESFESHPKVHTIADDGHLLKNLATGKINLDANYPVSQGRLCVGESKDNIHRGRVDV